MAATRTTTREPRTPSGAFSARAEERRQLDQLLSSTFNTVLRVEEQSLKSRLTEGLTISEIHAIAAVGLYERNPMSVVAARLNVTLATLTTTMRRLVEKGFVARTRDEIDRRKVIVSLTKTGRQVYRVHELFHRRMIDEALSGLDDQEEQVLSRSLLKVKAFFERQLDE